MTPAPDPHAATASVFVVLEDHGEYGFGIGPVFATDEVAQRAAAAAGNDWHVEELPVRTEVRRVTMGWAQRNRIDGPDAIQTGTTDFWDYETGDLPQTPWLAWAESEDAAASSLIARPYGDA